MSIPCQKEDENSLLEHEDEDYGYFLPGSEVVSTILIINGNKHLFEYNLWMEMDTTSLIDMPEMAIKDINLLSTIQMKHFPKMNGTMRRLYLKNGIASLSL